MIFYIKNKLFKMLLIVKYITNLIKTSILKILGNYLVQYNMKYRVIK